MQHIGHDDEGRPLGRPFKNGAETRPVVPQHVAIIMDGNGRWAAAHRVARIAGHRRGVEALRRAVQSAMDVGIGYLTVYSFSSENWARPVEEVSDLMRLLKRFIRNDLTDLHRHNVRVRIIGMRDNLQPDIQALLVEAEERTRLNTALTLVVAFNYGARQELAAAVRRIAFQVASGEMEPHAVTADLIATHLDTAGIPDPDLIIRTSGEQRLSNFLMWQAAYAELVFLPMHWPDFDRSAFDDALATYCRRERRFGGVTADHTLPKMKSAL